LGIGVEASVFGEEQDFFMGKKFFVVCSDIAARGMLAEAQSLRSDLSQLDLIRVLLAALIVAWPHRALGSAL
jgi:hypothetical protein